MKKADQRRLERRTFYKVTKANGAHMYDVRRFLDYDFEKWYSVTLMPGDEDEGVSDIIWCDCTGFKIQKFPHIDHKHIKLVLDYQERGEPMWAKYRIQGTGAVTAIEFIQQAEEEEET